MNVSLNVVSGVVTLAAASKSKEVAFDNSGSSAQVALKGLVAGLSALVLIPLESGKFLNEFRIPRETIS